MIRLMRVGEENRIRDLLTSWIVKINPARRSRQKLWNSVKPNGVKPE